MTISDLVQYADLMVDFMTSLRGSPNSGHGAGDKNLALEDDYGASRAARRMREVIWSSRDTAVMRTLGPPLDKLVDCTHWERMVHDYLYRSMQAITILAQTEYTQVTGKGGTLGSWLTYNNIGAGGPWHSLMSPLWSECYRVVFQPAILTAHDIYAPTAMIGHSVGGKLIDLAAIDARLYAGAAVARVQASNGAGKINVLGTARDRGGTVVMQRFFTCDGSRLVPAISGDLLLSVDKIECSPSAEVSVFSAPPDGRPDHSIWQ